MSSLFGSLEKGATGGVTASTAGNNQLGAWSNLNQIAGYGTSQGESDLNQGSGFWSSILSGDPTKIGQAIAPEANIINGQTQQQRQQLAQFSGRSGGTGGAAQQLQSNAQGQIQGLINQLIPQAATNLTGIGQNLLGLASSNSSTVGSQAEDAKEWAQKQENALGSGLFGMLQGGIGNIGSGGSFLEDLGQFGLGAIGA